MINAITAEPCRICAGDHGRVSLSTPVRGAWA